MKNYTLKDLGNQMLDGLFYKNPVLVQMLGMCSTLAITTSITNALGMGLAVTAVLICSNVFISLLRNFIPKEIRIASYIVIISGFVTAIQLLIKAFLPALSVPTQSSPKQPRRDLLHRVRSAPAYCGTRRQSPPSAPCSFFCFFESA